MRRPLLLALALLATAATLSGQAIQTITPPILLGPPSFRDSTGLTTLLDASGEYHAWVIQVPKTGTIDRIQFAATTVTADGNGLRVRIETVDATNGQPSGTLVGGSSEVTIATTTPSAWNRSGAGLAASVTVGDFIAVKLLSPAGTTFNGTIRHGWSNYFGPGNTPGSSAVPYIVTFLGGVTNKGNATGLDMAVEYNDGTTPVVLNAVPATSVTSTAFNNGSTPDERGNLFQLPIPVRVLGVYHNSIAAGATQTMDIVLYDSGGSALGTITVDLDLDRTTGVGSRSHFFATPITLTANTDYRVVIKPTTASNVTTQQFAIDTGTGGTRLREATMIGTAWQLTTRTDAGAWTETADTIASVGLIVNGLSDGACSGGGGVKCIVR